jgi:hypothetical protein
VACYGYVLGCVEVLSLLSGVSHAPFLLNIKDTQLSFVFEKKNINPPPRKQILSLRKQHCGQFGMQVFYFTSYLVTESPIIYSLR